MIIHCRWTRTTKSATWPTLCTDAHLVAAPSSEPGEEQHRLEDANSCLQQMQQQLIRANGWPRWGDGGLVAHEINNPLAIIKTSVRIIQNQSREDSQTIERCRHRRGGEPNCVHCPRSRRLLPCQSDSGSGGCERGHPQPEPLLAHTLQSEQIALRVMLEPDLPQVCMASIVSSKSSSILSATLRMPCRQRGPLIQTPARVTGYRCVYGHRRRHPARASGQVFAPFFTTKEHEGGRTGVSHLVWARRKCQWAY